MRNLIPAFIFLSLLAWAAWLLGIFWYRIEYDKGAWWPDMGKGLDKIKIWHNGEIVMSDSWDWKPDNRDSLYRVHRNAADEYIKSIK